ncbi:hypothetical protein AB5N19_02966 [Seiridium cardinale]
MRRVEIVNFVVAVLWVPVVVALSTNRGKLIPRDDLWIVGQTVKTTSGPATGHAAPNRTEVSEYLGIPYAKPPVDDLRWQPPVQYLGLAPIDATKFGFACMQATPLASAADTGDLSNLTESGASLVETYIKPDDDPTVVLPQSEDCLTLNVWTKPQVGEAAKAVMIWIQYAFSRLYHTVIDGASNFADAVLCSGGSFTSGSSLESWYDGQYVSEEQDIVLVSINYRLNIFGFPGSPLTPSNLGLQDQRLAIEWVRDNIAGFGGDPTRITIFGQSAGAASVDMHSYAYADDPIAAGYIPESGTSTGFGLNTPLQANELWFDAAKSVGCDGGPTDPQAVFDCMKNQPAKRLANNVPAIHLGDTDGLPFGPVIDGVLVFDDYDRRTPAARPMLIGNTDNESALFKYMVPGSAEGVPESYWNNLNNQGFTCPAGLRASRNVVSGNPTWRYRWFGTFPNLVLDWFPSPTGAWHGSEIPSLFNQTPDNGIPNTLNQIAIGMYMRTAWASFAKDPAKGLLTLGWPQYSTDGKTLVCLALNDTLGPNLDKGDAYDQSCLGIPNAVSGGDSVAVPSESTSLSEVAAFEDVSLPDFMPPIPLNWTSLCNTGFWMGYFCIL